MLMSMFCSTVLRCLDVFLFFLGFCTAPDGQNHTEEELLNTSPQKNLAQVLETSPSAGRVGRCYPAAWMFLA